MTEDHPRPDMRLAQGILLDDPGFLKEIVERVLQELLEAEMTEHIGAAPYERGEGRKEGPSKRSQAEGAEDAGGHA